MLFALLETHTVLICTTLSLFCSCPITLLLIAGQRSVTYQGQVHVRMFNELIGRYAL